MDSKSLTAFLVWQEVILRCPNLKEDSLVAAW